MIKHIWSVFCRESKIEQETNNISIIDAYESLQFDLQLDEEKLVQGKPIIGPFKFEIVSLFYREKKGREEAIETLLRVVDPKGVEIGKFVGKGAFAIESNRIRIRLRFNDIAITTSGTYFFQVYLKKDKSSKKEAVASVPVDIKITVNGKAR